MTDLSDLNDGLRRSVAPPGDFATYFPTTGDDDLTGTLMDAFSECQLDGFFVAGGVVSGGGSSYDLDVNSGLITPDITNAGCGLVLIYAAGRFLRAVLANRPTATDYEARGARASTAFSATILVEILRETDTRKKDILKRFQTLGSGVAFHMADQFFIRATVDYGPSASIEAASLWDAYTPLGA
jgi:hypothetical protein